MNANPATNFPNNKEWRCPLWLPATLLALVTLLVYWPATSHDFISLDDPEYVTANSHVQGGFTADNIKWAFTSVVTGNWHPITMLSHMLDCQWFGLKPGGHHFTSILLHALDTALLFLLLQRLTGALWRSVMVAALFGLHPMHVESVAWVAERKDVLSTFFGLLCLIAYVKYASGNSRPGLHYSLALLFFALGLMCKTMLVTLPFVMLLLDHWPLARFNVQSPVKLVTEKIPFFVLTAAACVMTWLVQSTAMLTLQNVSPAAKLENALISYGVYIGKLFWPMHLAVFYPFPAGRPLWQAVDSGALIVGITALCIIERLRRPYLLIGWLWYLGMLVPVIGLVQVGAQAMADRYTYLPYTGLFIMIVWGGHELAARGRVPTIIATAMACMALILCAGVTRQQLGYWKNNATLYQRAIAVTDNNYLMSYFLGVELFNEGNLVVAIEEYKEAIRIKPDYTPEHYDLGNALALNGQTEAAIAQYREAIRQKPDYYQAWHGLGTVLGRSGQTGEAIKTLQEAVRLKSDNAQYHYDLGIVLLIDNQADGAVAEFNEAIRLKPDFTQARQYLEAAQQIKNGSQKILP